MAKRKVLITGARGQLGTDLADQLGHDCEVNAVDIEDFDIRDGNAVNDAVTAFQPNIVLHAAAYTDVDGCETDLDTALGVNFVGTENVAASCRQVGARLIYYSTDYVFDGSKSAPYIESDVPNPLTVYGMSKLAGEGAVTSVLQDYAILRVAWLYSRHGKNFLRTMIQSGYQQMRQAQQGQLITPLKVVDDQIGNPTWTIDVVRQTREIIGRDLTGVFHATSEYETSWYGFAQEIFDFLHMPVQSRPCTSDQVPRAAARPKYSSLENRRLKEVGAHVMRNWKDALHDFLGQLGETWQA